MKTIDEIVEAAVELAEAVKANREYQGSGGGSEVRVKVLEKELAQTKAKLQEIVVSANKIQSDVEAERRRSRTCIHHTTEQCNEAGCAVCRNAELEELIGAVLAGRELDRIGDTLICRQCGAVTTAGPGMQVDHNESCAYHLAQSLRDRQPSPQRVVPQSR